MKEALVTGGAGFIGSHIQDRLIETGYTVTVLDNLSTGSRDNLNPEASLAEVDLRDSHEVRQVLRNVRPQIVFHLAAQSAVPDSMEDPIYDENVNISGTVNLLEAAKNSGVEKVVYSNSGGTIYGTVDKSELPLDEEHDKNPVSFYGLSKLVGERYLELYGKNSDLDWVSLRYSNVYGPRQVSSGEVGIISIFVDRFVNGKTPIIFGDGLHTRDYIFVDDVVSANMKAAEHEGNNYFNISSGIGTSNIDIYNIIVEILGIKDEPVYGPERPGDVRDVSLANSKALEVLKWAPKYDLKRGIQATVDYFLEAQRLSSELS